VAGFMTEHGSSIFVFFFLGEYSSLILMSAFMSIFFLGGHHCPDLHKFIYEPFIYVYYSIISWINNIINYNYPYISYIDNLYFKEYEYEFNKYNIDFTQFKDNIIDKFNDLYSLELHPLLDSEQKYNNTDYITEFTDKDIILNTLSLLIDKIQGSYILGFKIIIVVFFYIWIRASFPRLRYDQLMSLCWKELLPLVFAYIIFTLCLFYTFDMLPFGTTF